MRSLIKAISPPLSITPNNGQQGQTNLFNRLNGAWAPNADDPTRVVASGAWATKDCFKVVVRLLETPFFYNLAYHFVDDGMLVEVRINITLDIPKTLMLTASLSMDVLQESS